MTNTLTTTSTSGLPFESISQRCHRANVQLCSVCDDLQCSDNASLAKIKITELNRDNQFLVAELKKAETIIAQLQQKVESLEGRLTVTFDQYDALERKDNNVLLAMQQVLDLLSIHSDEHSRKAIFILQNALGTEMCTCGHGLAKHATPGMECSVMACPCSTWHKKV